ncbi:MAG: NADAR family protein [Sarcina sp.]
MRYSVEQVCDSFKKKEKLKYIYFWGHRKGKKGVTKSCFSQWYDSDFTVDGVLYNCAEQFMMAQKAKLFGDEEIYAQILETSEQFRIKYLGRQVKDFDEEVWQAQRYNIVLKGNIAKFSQNEEIKEFLVNTGYKVIVEASPYDIIWGIGMSEQEAMQSSPTQWKGENLLGFALMEARDIILNSP